MRTSPEKRSKAAIRAWYDEYYELDEEVHTSYNPKRIIIYSVSIILIISVGTSIYFATRSDSYIFKLRTQYCDDLISEADKAKLSPLEYNVKRLAIEDGLDVFLNPELTTKERKQIAPIILNTATIFSNGIDQGYVSESRKHRVYEKFEKALAMGIQEMAK